MTSSKNVKTRFSYAVKICYNMYNLLDILLNRLMEKMIAIRPNEGGVRFRLLNILDTSIIPFNPIKS